MKIGVSELFVGVLRFMANNTVLYLENTNKYYNFL